MKKRPPKKAKIRAIAQPDARSAAAFTAFQREMAAAVMRPLARNGGMRRGSRAVRLVKPNDRLTSFERLEIYNVQYWMRVLDSLREDFPGVAAVLGEEKFARLAEAYLDRHPSRSYTLRNLGDRLEGFIRRNPRWTRPHTALAADLARLEWAQVVAFDGEALPVLTPADLAATPPQRLRVRLQPYLSLLTLSYPADNFLLSLKKEGRLRGEASNALEQRRPARKARKEHPLPAPEKVFLAVHRVDSLLYAKRLAPAAFRVLKALQAGKTLAQACSSPALARHADELGLWFATWAELGWLARRPPGRKRATSRAAR